MTVQHWAGATRRLPASSGCLCFNPHPEPGFRDRLETMIRKALPLLAALAFTASAHAQLAAYGTVTLNSLGGSGTSPLAPKTDASGNPVQYLNNVNPIGGTFGVYYDFRNVGPVRLGVDARGVITNGSRGPELGAQGTGVRIGSGLAGIRASVRAGFGGAWEERLRHPDQQYRAASDGE